MVFLFPRKIHRRIMDLKPQTIKSLKQIIEKDYGVLISDEEAQKLGISILKITKMSLVALARAEEKKNLSSLVSVNNTLESNTSK